MIGATTLSMDVIPDEEDDLTMAPPHDNNLANKSSEDMVSCKHNSANIKIFIERFKIKAVYIPPNGHWLSLHESDGGILPPTGLPYVMERVKLDIHVALKISETSAIQPTCKRFHKEDPH
jgi:hypothetical protein